MTRFISLSEFFWLAEQVTGTDAEVLDSSGSINLADSALHAPQASFGGQDFYPDLIDKAAVLACHIAWNHPLPDGNKRVSWACLLLFLDLNDVVWDPDPPDFDEAEEAVLAMAARDVDEVWLAKWLRERTRQVKS
ncbi:MAG TPA: Fic family protein [Acidimicrobiales bacterium]